MTIPKVYRDRKKYPTKEYQWYQHEKAQESLDDMRESMGIESFMKLCINYLESQRDHLMLGEFDDVIDSNLVEIFYNRYAKSLRMGLGDYTPE